MVRDPTFAALVVVGVAVLMRCEEDAVARAQGALGALAAGGGGALHTLMTVDAPELLRLSASALSTMPWPETVAGWSALGAAEWLRLAPLLALGGAALSGGALGRGRGARPTYELTRSLLLRGMGLCYLCGFATHAFQGVALYGSGGIGSGGALERPRDRPAPAFDALARVGVGGDLALDGPRRRRRGGAR